MENYPKPARDLVAQMISMASARPQDAVAFQGAPGAYSHLATRQLFPLSLPLPCFSFEDALEAVQTNRAELAVIPIENNLHGRVADMHLLLPASDLHIVGEHFLRVRHCLIGLPEASQEDLAEVVSHPQGLGQCRERLRAWGLKPVAYADTAGSAALIMEQKNKTVGAIASRLAAELYGAKILAEGIEDVDHNTTRFVVLSRNPVDPDPLDGPLMTTFSFEVRSIPAALYKALGGFATNGVNMTRIESYLRGDSFSVAEFLADIEGSPRQPNVALAMDELRFHSKWVRILGTYPQARSRVNPASS